jgi:hypothetical protein
VESAVGVFQVGGAHVFSIALGYGRPRKLGWRSVAETAVRPCSLYSATQLVIFLRASNRLVNQLPRRHSSRSRCGSSPHAGSVLACLAGCGLLVLSLQRPSQKVTTGQLRAVVTTNRQWRAATGDAEVKDRFSTILTAFLQYLEHFSARLMLMEPLSYKHS